MPSEGFYVAQSFAGRSYSTPGYELQRPVVILRRMSQPFQRGIVWGERQMPCVGACFGAAEPSTACRCTTTMQYHPKLEGCSVSTYGR